MSLPDIIFMFRSHIHNSGQNCLLPDRPNFGLNIKFDQISCYILFHRFLDMPMSFLAAIFTFRPPYIIQAENSYCLVGQILGLNFKFDHIS